MKILLHKFVLFASLGGLVLGSYACSSEDSDSDPGGTDFDDFVSTGGGQPSPRHALSQTWFHISTEDAPSASRYYYDVLNTGEKVVLFGGSSDADETAFYSDGTFFDPLENTWTAFTSPTALTDRSQSFWDGDGLYTYGGFSSQSGQVYDSHEETWTALPDGPKSTDSDRGFVGWTGTDLVTWGGWIGEDSGSLDTSGAILDVEVGTWSSMGTTDAGVVSSYSATAEVGMRTFTYYYDNTMVFVLTDSESQTTLVQSYNLNTGEWSELADEDNFYIIDDLGMNSDNTNLFLVLRREIDAVDEDEFDTLQRAIVTLNLETLDFTEIDELPDLKVAGRGVYQDGGVYMSLAEDSNVDVIYFAYLDLSTKELTYLTDDGKPTDLVIEKLLYLQDKLVVIGKQTGATTPLFSGAVYTP